jgi:tetratricopeptide (TPR) repeat protein
VKETAPPVVVAPKEPVQVITPASPDVRQLLNEGRAALALKDYNTAGIKYEAALGLDPTNTVALANLGVIRYQQNRLDDAEQYLRKAAAAAPNDSNTRSLLGVVYFRKGAIEDAYSELNRAVAIDPHNAEAHNYLVGALPANWKSVVLSRSIRSMPTPILIWPSFMPKNTHPRSNSPVIITRKRSTSVPSLTRTWKRC